MPSLRSLLLVVATWIFLSDPTSAQYAVSGVVRVADTAPFKGASVTLTLGNSQEPIALVETQDDGRFHLEVPAPGIYGLDLAAPGFPTSRLYPLPITEGLELPPLLLGQKTKSPPPFPEPASLVPIEGQILTIDSHPISGALVWQDSIPHRFTFTDAKGRFTLQGTTKGWLEAEAKGFLPNARRTRGTAEHDLELILESAVPLSGRVVDTQGRPAVAVELVLKRLDNPWEPQPPRLDRAAGRAFSASDGTFLLPRLDPEGAYALRASRPGLRTIQAELGAPNATGSDELRLVMESSRAAFGRVVDRDERPIVGVEILQRPVGLRRHLAKETTITSDENGYFTFEHTPSRVELFARKSGYAPLRVRGLDIPSGDSDSDSPFDLGILVLEPGASLHGIVQDPEGKAIVGASLWIRGDLTRPAWHLVNRLEDVPASAESEDQGRFRFDDLPPGERFHLIVRHPHYLPNVAEAVEVPNEESLVLVLEPGLEVRGEVLDVSEQPIAGAQVTIEPSRPLVGATEVPLLDDSQQQDVTTEADGAFHFENVASGQLVLRGSAPGYLNSDELHLDTRTDQPRTALRLVLRRGAVLAGRVTTSEGDPVAGVRIEAGSARAFSDLDGEYRIEAVEPGRVRVEARHRIYRTVETHFEVEEGVNHLDLEMPLGHSLAGHVVGPDGSAVRATLELRSDGGRERHRHLAFADDEGRFVFEEVAEGTYRLEARAAEFASASESLEITGSVESMEVVLPREITLTGEILGLDFNDLANLSVQAVHATRRPLFAEIDFDGRYTLRGLAPGAWRLCAQTRDQRRQIEAHIVLDPEPAEVERDLEFGQGHRLSGQVLDGEEPLAGARISVRGHDNSADLGALTDQDGQFELLDVAPGGYRVGVTHPRELVIHNRDIALETDVDLLFEISTSVVQGYVVSAANGQPIEDVSINLQQLLEGGEGSVFASPTNAEGFFGFPRIPLGSFRLSLSKRGYAALRQTLEVSTTTEPLHFHLESTQGLELEPRLLGRVSLAAMDSAPSYVHVALLGGEGLPLFSESRAVEAGRVVLPTVPPGVWRLLVQAPGSALVEVLAEVPGAPIRVDLPPASRLKLRVPALLESRRTATAWLVNGKGSILRGFSDHGALTSTWRVVGGLASIEWVPAGEWTVHVKSETGEAWVGKIRANEMAEIDLAQFEGGTPPGTQ